MTLKIDISPEFEASLKEAALRQGLDEAEFAKKLLENSVASPVPVRDQATLDLFAKWAAEAKSITPEERIEAERELEEFKKAMNDHSTRGYPIYP